MRNRRNIGYCFYWDETIELVPSLLVSNSNKRNKKREVDADMKSKLIIALVGWALSFVLIIAMLVEMY